MATDVPTSRGGHTRSGRPRSDATERAILDAFVDLLLDCGLARLRLEHVAKRAGVSKASIYRRWASKEELALHALGHLADPDARVPDLGNARADLRAIVTNAIAELTESQFGRVAAAMLCEIASDADVAHAFRARVIERWHEEIREVTARGVRRGELDPATLDDVGAVTAFLLGPVCFRAIFREPLDPAFAAWIVDAFVTVSQGQAQPRELEAWAPEPT